MVCVWTVLPFICSGSDTFLLAAVIMATSTNTQTTVIERNETNYLEYLLNNKPKQCLFNDNNNNRVKETKVYSNNTDIYDQVLPRNEGKILSCVREWEKSMKFETPIRWIHTIGITIFHVVTVVGMLVDLFVYHNSPKWQTSVYSTLLGFMAGLGVTAGAHRYWCHNSYKAKWPLKIILLLCYTLAGQNNLYQWVRDHRVHHKFSETSADPHNANRGFFFSHVGWLMMKKHPDVLREGSKIDMSDLLEDPLVRLHTKYFPVFKILICFIIPFFIPTLLWDERWSVAFFSQSLRYMLSLHFTWSVNSFAHLWGNKPYDRHIMPAENPIVSIFAFGEGWHNYHHTFPWDYKAAELPYSLNATTLVIDVFSRIGWAYDMKAASPSLIQAVVNRRGDPNCRKMHHH